MKTLLFLDIDGVLNHAELERSSRPVRGRSRRYFDYLRSRIDLECLQRLNLITDMTGAQIVLSSSWRYIASWEKTAEGLYELGMTGEMIGRTAVDDEIDVSIFERYRGRLPATDEPYPRGYEIQQWIDAEYVAPKVVILDDDADMEHLFPRLVQTDKDRGGLQLGHAQRAIQILS